MTKEGPKCELIRGDGNGGRESASMSKSQKRKRERRNKKPESVNPHRPGVSPVQPLPPNGHTVPNKEENKNSNGWRDTPIIEEVSSLTDSRSPTATAAKPNANQPLLQPSIGPSRPRRSLKCEGRDQSGSGWATEDATDAQDLPEFDFAHNLSKFDKRGVFDQLKQEDTTADRDRLVNQNKAPKKLRYDENVLGNGTNGDSTLHFDGAASEGWAAGESELSMDESGNRRSGLRERGSMSNEGNIGGWLEAAKPSAKMPPPGHRTNSVNPSDIRRLQQRNIARQHGTADRTFGPPSMFAKAKDEKPRSGQSRSASVRAIPATGSNSGSVKSSIKASPHADPNRTSKEDPQIMANKTSNTFTKSRQLSNSAVQPFQLQPTFHTVNNPQLYSKYESENTPLQSCPTLTALQSFELEQVAVNEYGLTEEILTENAGRSLVQVVLEESRFAMRNGGSTVVILAGNNKTGARAIAAGRHILNRGIFKVELYVLGLNNRETLIEAVAVQLESFELCVQPSAVTISEFTDMQDRALDRQRTVAILDAVLGVHATLNDLSLEDRISYDHAMSEFEDMYRPGPTKHYYTQHIPIDDFSHDYVSPWAHSLSHNTTVVALAAPKTELMSTLLQCKSEQPKIFVVDVGIPKQAWAKLGLPRWKEGMSFGTDWIRELELWDADGTPMREWRQRKDIWPEENESEEIEARW